MVATCIVCGSSEGLQEHHVIPRTYGGLNGPTVILCTKHHALVHSLAQADNEWLVRDKLISHYARLPKAEFELEGRVSKEGNDHLLQLASVIIRAKNSIKHESRRMTITHVLSPLRAEKFKRLRDSRGFTTGQFIDFLLDSVP